VRAEGGFVVLRAEWRRVGHEDSPETSIWDPPAFERLAIAPGDSAALLVEIDPGRHRALAGSQWQVCLRDTSDWPHPVCSPAQHFLGLDAPRVH
jgi:hypothetical protein